MSQSIWWPDELWWERKVVPLGFVSFSVRQLATIMGGVLLGLLASRWFAFPIDGVSFGGRALVFFLFVGLAYAVAVKRVKMLPLEAQVLYVFRKKGSKRLRERLASLPVFRKFVKARADPMAPAPRPVQEMTVEDFNDPVPFAIASRVGRLGERSRVSLFLDEDRRADAAVTPEKPGYRLLYRPRPGDVGVHRLTARLEATGEVLVSLELRVGTTTKQAEATRAPVAGG